MSKNKIFIHTNKKQYLGALVAQYMIEKYSENTDKFTVEIICLEDFPALYDRQGKSYTRSGIQREWDNHDLQSFTLTRFLPPQLMGYEGRSIVIDPDIFALADVYELFTRDMGGKAILCRKDDKGHPASSVMLMDNTRLKHWKWEEGIEELFSGQRDYRDWMSLQLEDQSTIGEMEKEWNSFDELNEQTKMLHNTKRLTQPWRTGLPITFTDIEKKAPAKTWKDYIPFKNQIKALLGRPVPEFKHTHEKHTHHMQHPDQAQIDLFFTHLQGAYASGLVKDEHIKEALDANEIRPDIYDVLKQYQAKAA